MENKTPKQNKIRVPKSLSEKFIKQKDELYLTIFELIDQSIKNLDNKEFIKKDKELSPCLISFNSSKEWRDEVNKLAKDVGLSFSMFVRECLELELRGANNEKG